MDEPNEKPTNGRLRVGHEGERQPAKSAPQELRFGVNHDPGYRVPHIVADLVAARPIHLAIIDGVESIAGGEGPWIRGVRDRQAGRADRRHESGVHGRGRRGGDGLQSARDARHGAVPEMRQHAAAGGRRTASGRPT